MIESQTTSHTSPSARQLGRLAAVCVTVLPAALFVVLLANLRASGVAHAAGTLTVAISAGYNLVVDSNVLAPSTYAPSAATVAGTFCNTGDQPLADVRAFIGDYDPNGDNNPSYSTPGLYPARDSANAALIAHHRHLPNDGDGNFDYNAWLQPVGGPSYDPGCFRLVRTTGVLTVSRRGGQPPLIITF